MLIAKRRLLAPAQAGRPGPSPHPGQAREGLQTVPREMEKPLRVQNRTQGTAYSKEGKEEKKRRGEESSLQNLRRLCQTASSVPVVTQHSSLDVTKQTQKKSAFFYLPLHFVHYIPPPCLCMFLSPIVWYTDPTLSSWARLSQPSLILAVPFLSSAEKQDLTTNSIATKELYPRHWGGDPGGRNRSLRKLLRFWVPRGRHRLP